jgi:hypothetical protein
MFSIEVEGTDLMTTEGNIFGVVLPLAVRAQAIYLLVAGEGTDEEVKKKVQPIEYPGYAVVRPAQEAIRSGYNVVFITVKDQTGGK